MAILIADDESSTRKVLRELIEAMGLGPVIEARDGKEASQMLEQHKSRIELIISDREMPEKDGLQFLADVEAAPLLDQVPFLLITSEEIDAPKGRLDGILLKPFQLERLRKALYKAGAARAAAHPAVVCFGGERLNPVRELVRRGSAAPWKELVETPQGESLEKICVPLLGKLGAVFCEPVALSEADLRWLQQLKKTPWGNRIQVICAASGIQEALPVRMGPDHFVLQEAPLRLWEILIPQLVSRASSLLEQEIHQKEYREKFQNKDYKSAQSAAESLLKLDPRNSDYTLWLAKCFDALEKQDAALIQFRRALFLNPLNTPAICALVKLLKEMGLTAEHGDLVAQAQMIDPKLKLS